jgi:hypothetical protein
MASCPHLTVLAENVRADRLGDLLHEYVQVARRDRVVGSHTARALGQLAASPRQRQILRKRLSSLGKEVLTAAQKSLGARTSRRHQLKRLPEEPYGEGSERNSYRQQDDRHAQDGGNNEQDHRYQRQYKTQDSTQHTRNEAQGAAQQPRHKPKQAAQQVGQPTEQSHLPHPIVRPTRTGSRTHVTSVVKHRCAAGPNRHRPPNDRAMHNASAAERPPRAGDGLGALDRAGLWRTTCWSQSLPRPGTGSPWGSAGGSTDCGGCVPACVTGCTGLPWLAASRLGYLTGCIGRVPLGAALVAATPSAPTARERNR